MEASVDFNLNVLGESNMAIEKSIDFTLEVLPAGDLFCEIVPLAQAVRRGRTAVYSVNLRSLNEFTGTVDVTITGLAAPIVLSTALAVDEAVTLPLAIDTTDIVPGVVALNARIVGTEV